jgi:hypothetical protein
MPAAVISPLVLHLPVTILPSMAGSQRMANQPGEVEVEIAPSPVQVEFPVVPTPDGEKTKIVISL